MHTIQEEYASINDMHIEMYFDDPRISLLWHVCQASTANVILKLSQTEKVGNKNYMVYTNGNTVNCFEGNEKQFNYLTEKKNL